MTVIPIPYSGNKEKKLSIYTIFLAGNVERMLVNNYFSIPNERIDLRMDHQWMLNLP